MEPIIDIWTGCYPSRWKGMIVPEAIVHPAKFSSRLIARIYHHMLDEGWLKAGDVVLDPFAGVALGALDAMRLGLHWRGVELERKFADLGNANIEYWNRRFSKMPHWESDALLLCGDSRNLLQIIAEARTAVSNPPYSEARIGQETGQAQAGRGDQYGETPGQLGAMNAEGFDAALASPPFLGLEVEKNDKGIDLEKLYETYKASGAGQTFEQFVKTQRLHSQDYGDTPGQLAHMPEGDIQAAITSPPFRQSEGGTDPNRTLGWGDPNLVKRHAASNAAAKGYGESGGQLANMQDGDFEAAVSSPPFNENKSNAIHGETKGFHSHDESESKNRMKRDYLLPETPGNLGQALEGDFDAALSSPPYLPQDDRRIPWGTTAGTDLQENDERRGFKPSTNFRGSYSLDPANLGNPTGADQTDFWMAARRIIDQVFILLEPGGHAVWVVKDFVKDNERVPFCQMWRRLCEAAGFVTLHEHRAMLLHRKGKSHTLEGKVVEHKTESKSFFRRMVEHRAAIRNYWSTRARDEKAGFFMQSRSQFWAAYRKLPVEEKTAVYARENELELLHPLPSRKLFEWAAINLAWEASGEKFEDWNSDVRIDYEIVFCMVKPK